MLRYLAMVVAVILLAGCAASEEPVGLSEVQSSSTSVTTTERPPTTAATTSTSTTTTSTTATTSTTPPAIEPTTTSVPMSLPPGAIGPSQFHAGDDSLRALIGVATYRIETTVTVPLAPDGDELGVVVARVDVAEGNERDNADTHITVTSVEGQPPYYYEEINLGDRVFFREGKDDAWYESDGGYDIVGPVAPIPYKYADLHGASWSLPSADWLGNEEIDGVPVGHYTWSDSDETSGVSAYGESWVDAEGVVRRWIYEIRFGEMLFSRSDAVLYDLGADVNITVPEGL